ncbi:Phosphomethylpyrimidine kinase [Liberibacter crescens BT-1]|uniref:hydroxymethylpyrimidine kinase n=1 Tax=Liberibacter crescens (strain BT-1) TaxID=1215343 RepID=L0ETW5_LIBCB|nr:bifunctional hydroxymethylpyrimidine kinase/phosphomethylpyrimidine kinase [Liberibacter crescens]AGA64078.1 Phosphomethylpyrimidine kinase [Liberibacter crescens BT-1]AMC12367.1 hydroxymethylpyrimidine kinase [Liberibacter crescens]
MTANAVTIAGSDSIGGAGIQADLKTFSALGVYGATVITAITAQNIKTIRRIENVSSHMVSEQMEAVFTGLSIKAVKVGMVSSKKNIIAIAEGLSRFKNMAIIDPVMISSSGYILLDKKNISVFKKELLPLALMLTPNLEEAAFLTGEEKALSEASMKRQAEKILKLGAQSVLLKGGHFHNPEESVDIFFNGKTFERLISPRIKKIQTHGTGCTLSAAITAYLAKGETILDAARKAKTYLYKSLESTKKLKISHTGISLHHFHEWWD